MSPSLITCYISKNIKEELTPSRVRWGSFPPLIFIKLMCMLRCMNFIASSYVRAYSHLSPSLSLLEKWATPILQSKSQPITFWWVFQKKKACQGEMASSSNCSSLPSFMYVNFVKYVKILKNTEKLILHESHDKIILHNQTCALFK
jgi:hypothetical protein